MATLSIASAKGGVGKTTVAISVSAELALDGYRVALLDCDLNQHASHFGKIAEIAGLTVVPAIDEKNVLPALRKAQGENDLVVIDLPGGSAPMMGPPEFASRRRDRLGIGFGAADLGRPLTAGLQAIRLAL